MSSAKAHAGDSFDVRVTSDVAIGRSIVISKGAPGRGQVVEAEAAGWNGRPGRIAVQLEWVVADDGTTIALRNESNARQGPNEAVATSVITYVADYAVGFPGQFAGYLVRGQNVVIDGSRSLTGYTADDARVAFSKTVPATPAPLPSGATQPRS
ncbi:MAG: hypothetical protein JOZ38_02165 [Candidatus Eremiobacteraeota bacterium]|nr:hypothetical protein [Candidatus Eremiobacteraeota bacterium]